MSDDLYDGPCEAGCTSFHGGERKHHPDCGHYPQSLTKLHADRIEGLEAKLAKIMAAVTEWAQARKQVAMGQVATWERLANAESALAAITETPHD